VLALVVAATTLAAPAQAASATDASVGYDVSYLDCDTPLPSTFGFALVNVNHGRPFTGNPCFASEVSWASGVPLSFYMNTANPGPHMSLYWPGHGTNVPQACDGSASATCAYDFGWYAAVDGFGRAVDVVGLTIATSSEWWLDVETANSWSDDQQANVLTLVGFADALRSEGISRIGIYATKSHWFEITGARGPESPINAPFSSMPNWIPRLGPADAATSNCDPAQSLTGGRVALVQYEFFLDKNVACPSP
jgi:hypothetical protein